MKRVSYDYIKPCLVILFALSNSWSCQCKHALEGNYGDDIVMDVRDENLGGHDRTTDLIFSIPHDEVVADLSKYILDIGVEDDQGHKITYPDKDGVHTVDSKFLHELTKLSKNSHLDADNKSINVPVTLLPKAPAKDMQVVCHLKTNTDNPRTVRTVYIKWKEGLCPITSFALAAVTPTHIIGPIKDIQIAIANNTSSASTTDLQLLVTRETGTTAVPLGSTPLGANQFVLSLPTIASHTESIQSITISPATDTHTSFRLQLQHEGKDIGKPLTVSWSICDAICVKEVGYNPITKKVACEFKNVTSRKLTGVKVICQPTNPSQFTIFNPEQLIGDLSSGAKAKLEIGSLGKKVTDVVAMTYSFAWTENGIMHNTAPVLYTFQPDKVDIGLDLDIQYDPLTRQVHLALTNKQDQPLLGLNLQYENVSKNPLEKSITLDGKQKATLPIAKIEPGETITQVLVLLPKDNQPATYAFKLVTAGTLLLKKEETFLPSSPISLSIMKPVVARTGLYTLYGPEKAITFKVKNTGNPASFDPEKLKMVIENKTFAGTIALKKGGMPTNEVPGKDLLKQDNITLYFEPALDQNNAALNFRLVYEGIEITNPIVVHWEEYKPYIELPTSHLVGEQIAEFNIYNANGPLDLGELSVHLMGVDSKNVRFISSYGDELDNDANLANMVLQDKQDDKLGIIRQAKFKVVMTPPDAKKKQPVNELPLKLVLKRGEKIVAEQTLYWLAEDSAATKEKNIEVRLSNYVIKDTDTINVILKNTTPANKELSLKEIFVEATTPLSLPVSFRFGTIAGKDIETTVDRAAGVNKLDPQVETIIPFSLGKSLGSKVATGIVLTFTDAKNRQHELQQVRILCVNAKLLTRVRELEDLIKQLTPHTINNLAYDELIRYQAQINKAINDYATLLQNIENIIKADPDFTPILLPVKATYEGDIASWQQQEIKLQEAINKIKQQGEVNQSLDIWQRKLTQQLQDIEEIVKEAPNAISKIEGPALVQFLVAPYKEGRGVAEQSLKALYKQLEKERRVLDAYCANAGTDTPRGALPKVKQDIKTKLPIIKAKIAGLLAAGFKKINEDLTKRKEKLKIKDNSKNQLDTYYSQIEGALNLLDLCNNMAKNGTHDVGLDPHELADFIVKEYDAFMGHIEALSKAYEKIKQHGAVEKCVRLSLTISEKVDKIKKSNPTTDVKILDGLISIRTKEMVKRSRSLSKNGNKHILNKKQNSVVAIPTAFEEYKKDAEENDVKKNTEKRKKELTRSQKQSRKTIITRRKSQ